MPSDIKLEDVGVLIEATNWTKLTSCDLALDAPGRRKEKKTPWRRALVHDVNDKLTINYAGDYPGGVNISGKTTIEDLTATASTLVGGFNQMGGGPALIIKADDLIFLNKDVGPAPGKTEKRNYALSHVDGDKLVINRGGGYTGGIEIEGNVLMPNKVTCHDQIVVSMSPGARMPHSRYLTITNETIIVDGPAPIEAFDLVAEIKALQQEVKSLKDKVAKLEK